jgi:hypothetical protein
VKKACSVPLLLVGVVLVGLGVYATSRGLDARDQVRAQLVAEELTTPAGASIPNARVDDAATATSFARFIDGAIKEATGGRSYNEVGRYLTATGSDTNDPAAAAVGAGGLPVPNPLRETAFEASVGTASLYTSVMAFHIGELAVGLGIVLLVLGAGLAVTGLVLSGIHVPATVRSRLHLPHLHPRPVA